MHIALGDKYVCTYVCVHTYAMYIFQLCDNGISYSYTYIYVHTYIKYARASQLHLSHRNINVCMHVCTQLQKQLFTIIRKYRCKQCKQSYKL